MDNRTLEEVRNNETKLIEEIKSLEKQLEYLRSGEYYNQLRFERDMLQNIVDNVEVSKEDKEFIDMTHRNTELLEENKKYKEVIDKAINSIDILQEIIYQQPTNNSADDLWLLDKLDGIKNILKEVE